MGAIEVTPIFSKRNSLASRVIISGVRDSKKAITFNDGLILNNSKGVSTKRVEGILRKGCALKG